MHLEQHEEGDAEAEDEDTEKQERFAQTLEDFEEHYHVNSPEIALLKDEQLVHAEQKERNDTAFPLDMSHNAEATGKRGRHKQNCEHVDHWAKYFVDIEEEIDFLHDSEVQSIKLSLYSTCKIKNVCRFCAAAAVVGELVNHLWD